jgi:cobalt-precorrin 5A hydrolase
VAGIGCRAGVSGEQVQAAIDAAIAELCAGARARATLSAIATPASKASELGIQTAAAARGVPLLAISQEALEAANPATVTRSDQSMAAMNVHSVAEAAALAGARVLADVEHRPRSVPDGNSLAVLPATTVTHRLLQPRIIVGPVTCALADTTRP